MQKIWSIIFGVMMLLALLISAAAPFVQGWWLPKNVASFGGEVDYLFYLILAITGFFFVLTEAILVYFMYLYAAAPGGSPQPKPPAVFGKLLQPFSTIIHDQHRLEIAWTVVPAAILLLLALVQIRAWADIKYQRNMPKPDGLTQQMEVTARQWEWRVRYPSPERMQSWEKDPKAAEEFARNPHEDDLYMVNEVHVWQSHDAAQRVLIHLRSRDVLHSLFFPNLRLKQDAVPGRVIPVWFRAVESNTVATVDPKTKQPRWLEEGFDPATGKALDPTKIWEVACAEYCGTRHSLMKGKLYVHRDKADFLKWLEHALAEQRRTQSETAATAAR